MIKWINSSKIYYNSSIEYGIFRFFEEKINKCNYWSLNEPHKYDYEKMNSSRNSFRIISVLFFSQETRINYLQQHPPTLSIMLKSVESMIADGGVKQENLKSLKATFVIDREHIR